MNLLISICIGLGLAASSGFRIFIPLLAANIASLSGFHSFGAGFEWLNGLTAFYILASASIIEIIAYYVPWLDNALDHIALPVAVAAGTLLSTSFIAADWEPSLKWGLGIIAGGLPAGIVHSGMVLLRLGSTATTGGVGNPLVTTAENIGEEFAEKGKKVKLDRVADTLVGAMVKRLASGKPHGIAVLAEGLVDVLDEKDLEESGGIFRDEQGHAAISDIDIGTLVRDRVRTKLKEMGIPLTVVTKNLGYELRCADPIPFDMEYARDLGHSAARFVIEGGSGAVVTMHADKFRAIPFSDMLTPEGRTRVRMVDLGSDRYRIAWGYMVRLKREDFEDEDVLRELAMTAKMSPEAFRERFYPVTEREPRILPLYTTLNATS